MWIEESPEHIFLNLKMSSLLLQSKLLLVTVQMQVNPGGVAQFVAAEDPHCELFLNWQSLKWENHEQIFVPIPQWSQYLSKARHLYS